MAGGNDACLHVQGERPHLQAVHQLLLLLTSHYRLAHQPQHQVFCALKLQRPRSDHLKLHSQPSCPHAHKGSAVATP